jgi:hypothetical protein
VLNSYAQEDGWKNFKWDMTENQMKKAANCKNGTTAPIYNISNFVYAVLLHHGIKITDDNLFLNDVESFWCPSEESGAGTYVPILFKRKFIGVIKDYSLLGFSDNPIVQKDIIGQLKAKYPTGKVTTVTNRDRGYKYLAFDYKSPAIEIFNENALLIMISTNGIQSMIEAYNQTINKAKSDKDEKMKAF